MMKCLKCGTVMEDGSVFCGNCGIRLKPTPAVIDGKKRKRTRHFVYHSGKTKGRSAVFFAGFALLLFLGLWIFIDTIPRLGGLLTEMEQAAAQLMLKSKYLAEGLPFRYVSANLAQLASAFSLLADLFFSSFLILFSGYFTYFFGLNLFLHLKYKAYYSYHRPIALEKVSSIAMPLGAVLFFMFLICYLILGLVQVIC